MSKNYWVIAALAVASILCVTSFRRPDKPRESLFLFLAAQALSWPATILMVFMGRFESPVRLFPKATNSNLAYCESLKCPPQDHSEPLEYENRSKLATPHLSLYQRHRPCNKFFMIVVSPLARGALSHCLFSCAQFAPPIDMRIKRLLHK